MNEYVLLRVWDLLAIGQDKIKKLIPIQCVECVVK